MTASPVPEIKGFYEPRTGSIQYVAACPVTRRCAIIDPVLDFEEKAGVTATRSADEILRYIDQRRYEVQWILDTHPHADHLSAADYLKQRTGAPTAIGARVVAVQQIWAKIYNTPDLADGGASWDKLFEDGETFSVGEVAGSILLSPGHTLASITYIIGDAAFVHDTLFMPDSGSARVDFPGGDAATQWRSIQKILSLPPATRIFTGHDYRPGGRAAAWGKHRRRSEIQQRTSGGGYRRGALCDLAQCARQDAADAAPDPARATGQSARRAIAGAGEQWSPLFQDSAGSDRAAFLG